MFNPGHKALYFHGASLHPGVKMGTGKFNAGDNPAMDLHLIQGGVEVLTVASCHRNWDKLQPDGPLGQNADFTFTKDCFSCLVYIHFI